MRDQVWLINDEDFSRHRLLGPRPFLDSFRASIALAKLEYPRDIENWFESIQVVPSFLTFQNQGRGGYYRATGCHELIATPKLPGVPKALLHVAVGKYDFVVDILSEKELDDHPYHKFYAAFCCFGQSRENCKVSKGGEVYSVDGRQYFSLFHHTGRKAKKSIIKDRFLQGSAWNFCGTRKMKELHCYITDLPKVKTQFDTLPLLIRSSLGFDIVFRTDDESKLVRSGVNIQNRMLDRRIGLLVDPGLIQPNPMVFHKPLKGQPKWLEVMFPYVYRIPCQGIKLERSLPIKGEKHWIVDAGSIEEFRQRGSVLWADGNDEIALQHLINETLVT